jgi:cysteine desulfurase
MKVYFDNAATTKIHPRVLEIMHPFLKEDFGNASSIHSFGRKARVAIEESREVIAGFINANPSEIYFTSGGTESNNFVLRGIARTEFLESNRNHIITSNAEHHCVLDACNNLAHEGFQLSLADVLPDTSVDEQRLMNLFTQHTSLLSLIHINNETGAINKIKEIAEQTKTRNIFVHTDTVQSFGKVVIDVIELKVDSLCASAHKINGPKGIGFAYVKSGTPLAPLIFGGSQERNRRGGTENVAAIVGFAEAVRIAKETMLENELHVKSLRKKFVEGLESFGKNSIRINGGASSSPYILSITFDSRYYKNDAEAMLMYLDIHCIAASNGAACTSGTLKPSHVILSSGYSEADANGTIRFSFSGENTIEEVDYTLDILNKMKKKFEK